MAYIKLEDLMAFPIRIDHYDKENGNEHFVYGVETVLEYAENLPIADVTPVVRCKDCRHKDRMSGGNVILCTRKAKLIRMKPDDYCSYGESCEHDFEYDELHREFVCKKCFHVLTREEKRELLEHANALRKAEEKNEQES